jgi:4-hydroxybenzoate polyprenyltransferase
MSSSSNAAVEEATVPLCVDLDGTLVKTDTLLESLVALARRRPLALVRAPAWLWRGRAAFKQELAARALPGVETLPYREDLCAHLAAERARGRRLVLATAADRRIAEAVAAHTGLFSEVLASDGHTNLKGARKRAALEARFGRFDYVGDSAADIPVWRAARRALVVGSASARPLRTLARAIRVHQWVKNALVFLPALAAHALGRSSVLVAALLAFVGFSLCASAGYLLNDLLDLESDRRDPKKRHRPLAAGTLSIRAALVMIPTLLASGLAIGWRASPSVALLLGVHFVATTWYSLGLKRVAVLDVMVLAGLYTLRIFTGAAADHVPVSPWLLGVSMFMFMSLALVKRVSELERLHAAGAAVTPGRGYRVDDLTLTMILGGASGYMTVLILAQYIHSPDVTVLYAHPERLWLLCPLLLFWVSRLWLLTSRGEMDADPVAFALKDRCSQLIGLAGLAIAWAAS